MFEINLEQYNTNMQEKKRYPPASFILFMVLHFSLNDTRRRQNFFPLNVTHFRHNTIIRFIYIRIYSIADNPKYNIFRFFFLLV